MVPLLVKSLHSFMWNSSNHLLRTNWQAFCILVQRKLTRKTIQELAAPKTATQKVEKGNPNLNLHSNTKGRKR